MFLSIHACRERYGERERQRVISIRKGEKALDLGYFNISERNKGKRLINN